MIQDVTDQNFYKVDLSEKDQIQKDLNFQNLIKPDIEKLRKNYYEGETISLEFM